MSANPNVEDEVRERLFEYLAARHEWELHAWQRSPLPSDWNTPIPDDLPSFAEEERREYRELMGRFLASSDVERAQASYGDPPSVDPTKTQVVSVQVRGSRAVVSTRETTLPSPYVSDEEFEYEWRRIADTWRLADRRTRGLDGRWIHRVW